MGHDFLGVYRKLIEAQSVTILIRGSDARGHPKTEAQSPSTMLLT